MSDQRPPAAGHRVSALIVAAVAAIGLIAGCAGSEKPPSAAVAGEADKKDQKGGGKDGEGDPKSSGTNRTPAPGKDPSKGTAVDAKLGEEAKKFVLDFMSAMDKAQPTGDFDKVEPMIGPTCRFCKNVIDWTAQIYKRGEKLEGGAYANPKPIVKGGSGRSVIVQVQATVEAYKIVDKSGKTTKSGKATETVSTFTVRKESGGWKVITWAQK